MATGWGRRIRVEQQKVPTGQTPTAETAANIRCSLSTANPNDDGQSNAEPTVTNGYARQTLAYNTLTVYTSVTNDTASNATNSALITFGPSSGGAFSTGATPLSHLGIWNHATNTAEVNYCGRGAIAGGGFAVSAAGISITFAANTGIVMGLISA